MIRNNLFYKLLALGIAISLWAYVNGERNPQARKSISVPIETRNAARGYAIDLSSSDATIVIQGPKTTIDSIRAEDTSAWIDMRRFGSDQDRIAGRAKVNAVVAGVGEDEVQVSTNPRYVKVEMEAIRSKRLPVEVKFVSAPPAGYAFTDPDVTPDTIEVSGKTSNLSRVRGLILRVSNEITAGIDARPVDSLVKIQPVDAHGRAIGEVSLKTSRVRLKLAVVPVPTTKSVFVSETITGRPRYPAKVTDVSVTPSLVTLQGKSQVLAGISTVHTEEVSIEGMHDNVTREVMLRLPPGVRAASTRKVTVTVTISDGE